MTKGDGSCVTPDTGTVPFLPNMDAMGLTTILLYGITKMSFITFIAFAACNCALRTCANVRRMRVNFYLDLFL